MKETMKRAPRHLPWFFNMSLLNLVEFASESSRGLTLPTLYLYVQSIGGDVRHLSYLISIFSFGRLISSTLVGYMADKTSMKAMFQTSLAISVLGNLLYVLASSSLLGTNQMTMLMFSRFVVGFGAGNRAVCRKGVTTITHDDSRLRFMTLLQATVYFGYAVTPGIAAMLPYSTRATAWEISGLWQINMYTVPGIALVLMNLMVLIGLSILFDERVDSQDEPGSHLVHPEAAEGSKNVDFEAVPVTELPAFKISEELVWWGVWLYLSLNFIGKGTLSVFETVTPVMYLDVTGQTLATLDPTETRARQIANFLFWLGLGGLAVLLIVASLNTKRSANDLLCWLSQLVQGLGCLFGAMCFLDPSMGLLLACEVLVWSLASPIAGAVVVSSFSLLIDKKQQGLYMGLIGSAGSLGRVFAPPINGYLMHIGYGAATFFFFAVASIVAAVAIIWFSGQVKRERKEKMLELGVTLDQ